MSNLNIDQARFNMIQQQIRPWDVADDRVLELIARLPREEFVPAAYRNLAFADIMIPLGHGQMMMEPKAEARFVQELAIGPKDTILEVGTGSGYVTALLASLGASVTSVEIIPELAAEAKEKLAAHKIASVKLEVGDAARGWAAGAPYDAILVTGSTPVLPEEFKQQLAIGGRLAVVVGQPPIMEAKLIRRLSEQAFEEISLFDTKLPPLINALPAPAFVF